MQRFTFTFGIQPLLVLSLLFLVIFLLLRISTRVSRKRVPAFGMLLATVSDVVLPTFYVLVIARNSHAFSADHWVVKLVQSLIGVELIWILLSAFRVIYLSKASAVAAQTRMPVLLFDVLRLALVGIGSAFVVSIVWNHDLTHFLTTLGIGSIVLGLALQETLGNFFAGVALLFERPFKAGDWIKVGEHEGEVMEVNWRSVRLRDRNNIMVILPNAVIGRERIQNFSQPSRTCGTLLQISFAYKDPPNQVKSVLLELLRTAPHVLKDPHPRIRTKTFADFAVTYEVLYFIDSYANLLDIEEDIKTRIWYAARRYDLTIPYPTRVIYKTEVAPEPLVDKSEQRQNFLAGVELFKPLTAHERERLAKDVDLHKYGIGEPLVEQDASGDSMFIVVSGTVTVWVRDLVGNRKVLSTFGPGDFFGEMALLTGEPRSATVSANSDVEVIEVRKDAIKDLLIGRPELLASMAEVAETRRANLEETKSDDTLLLGGPILNEDSVVAKIRSFFGLR